MEVEVGHRKNTRRVERAVVSTGLLMAATLGIAGAPVESIYVQTLLYALSILGWVVATSILVLRHTERGQLLTAAGFMILAIAETLLFTGMTPGDPGTYDSGFAAGAMFFGPGLLLVGIEPVYGRIARSLAFSAALAWAVFTVQYLTGTPVLEIQIPSIFGYLLTSVLFVLIAIAYLRNRAPWEYEQAVSGGQISHSVQGSIMTGSPERREVELEALSQEAETHDSR